MKDEIKEILESPNVYSFNDECYLYFGDYNKLKDYITNLQEENKKLKNKLEDEKKNYKRITTYLQEEIESQSKAQVILDNQIAEMLKYKERNEKAIEYINENKHLSMFADCREPEEDWNYDLEIDPRELLEILQGKSDE